jgi:hypothetical protein
MTVCFNFSPRPAHETSGADHYPTNCRHHGRYHIHLPHRCLHQRQLAQAGYRRQGAPGVEYGQRQQPEPATIEQQADKRIVLHNCALQLADQRLPPGWELVNSSSYARVAYNPKEQLYYKEFLPRSPLETLKAWVRGSRAYRARKNGHALLLAGIDAPENISWGKLPGKREYLFMRALPGQDITQWLRNILQSRSGEQLLQRRQLLADLGTFIGRVHATGFIHGDLRPGNVLADLHKQQFRFALIDNESNRQKVPPPGKMLLRNLMQLNMLPPAVLSRADRMRFFRAWHRQMRYLSPLEAKLLGAEAYHWAMRRMYGKGDL